MSLNWINALDACAAGGVIDYDAAAELSGAPSRFVGNPNFEYIPPLLPEDVKIKSQPVKDRYDNSGNVVDNPKWKKNLFIGVSITAILATVLAVLGKKGKIKMPKMQSVKNFGTNISNFFKKLFKKTP